jgi:transposase
LKEHEAGVSVADLCRKHGVSDASIYKWKAKFGAIELLEAKRLKTYYRCPSVRRRFRASFTARYVTLWVLGDRAMRRVSEGTSNAPFVRFPAIGRRFRRIDNMVANVTNEGIGVLSVPLAGQIARETRPT